MKTKKKLITFIANDNFLEDLEIIMRENGFTTKTMAIYHAVARFSREVLPNYQRKKILAPKREVYDNPIEREKARLAKEKEKAEAKNALVIQEGMNICELLGGEIINQEGGHTACKYKLYEKAGQRVLLGSRTVPLEDLTEAHLKKQYKNGSPSDIQALLAKQNS